MIQQAHGERNFHIFYQLLQSQDSALLAELGLTGKPEDYHYLSQVRRCSSTEPGRERELYLL